MRAGGETEQSSQAPKGATDRSLTPDQGHRRSEHPDGNAKGDAERRGPAAPIPRPFAVEQDAASVTVARTPQELLARGRSPEMDYASARFIDTRPAAVAEALAEILLLAVEEETLVEAAKRIESATADRQASPLQVVDPSSRAVQAGIRDVAPPAQRG